MTISRRSFLAASSAAAAAGALKPRPSSTANLQDWGVVRDQFDLAPGWTHLSMFYITSHPRPVRKAIDELRAKLDANPYATVEAMGFADDEAARQPSIVCGRLARYLGVAPGEIALTQNTTTGLAILHHGVALKAGDDVLLTTHDHYVHHEAARFAAQRSGASVRKITLYDSPDAISEDDVKKRVKAAILPSTRVMGTTWVLSSDGVCMPVKAIADALAEVNASRSKETRVLLFVDGVHGLGVEDPRLALLGCDGFASGTHKWIFGPRGTGFVWAKPEVWASMRPLIPTMTGLELFAAWRDGSDPGVPRAAWFTPGGFQAFEHLWALPAALDFHESLGPARIGARIHSLNRQLNEELRKMSHVSVRTPLADGRYAGIVSFDVKGMKAGDVVAKLAQKKIVASTSPYKDSCVRLSFGVMNTPEEIQTALKAVRALA